MPEWLQRWLTDVRERWNTLAWGQRVGVLGGIVLLVGTLIGIGVYANQPEWVVLYSGLTLEDASAVTAKLNSLNIKYSLAGDGTTIRVDTKEVRQARLQLAADGLPGKGAKGYELFDEAPLGMTPFMQHVNLGRAIQAELAKTIQQIEGVAYARVHIVRPDPTPFLVTQKPPTASVVLKLKPGAVLGRPTSNAIVALVAGAVEGLTPERVTIVDANSGRVLLEQRGPDGTMAGTQLEHRKELEAYLSARAEDMLAQVLGPGRAIVKVAADLDFKKVREKSETYNPEQRVVSSEKVVSRSETPAQQKSAGVTGATANLKTPGGGFNVLGGNNVREETIDTGYAISKTVRELEDRFGSIDRLTVAAMVDLTVGEGDQAAQLTKEDVEDIIRQAVGFKRTRGDEIKVTPTKLAAAAAIAAAETELASQQQQDYYIRLVRNGALGVAAVLAFLLGLLFLWRLRPAPEPPPEPELEPAPAPPSGRARALGELAQRDPAALAQLLTKLLNQGEQPVQATAK